MSRSLNLNVRVTGPLSEFVSAKVGDNGPSENVSEYVRDLIRRDKEHAEREPLTGRRPSWPGAFAAPEDACKALDAETVIARNHH